MFHPYSDQNLKVFLAAINEWSLINSFFTKVLKVVKKVFSIRHEKGGEVDDKREKI
jgi:hypothetical protein